MSRPSHAWAGLARAALLILLLVPAGRAQAPPRPGGEKGRIHVDVNLVTVIASVLDKNNRPAPDLPKEAFELYEEGVRQKIEILERETQQPLDLALMIDSSLSTTMELANETEAAARFIRQVVRPSDRLAVFEFADAVTQLTEFSTDVPLLQSAAKHIQAGAGTVLYDAVYLGAQALGRRDPSRRRVLVLVTDAGETTSHADFDAARRAALRAQALLYTIVIRPVKSEGGRNTAGEHALETITETTGGEVYYPDSMAELDAIFDRINRELRTQYRLGYYPEPRPPEKSFRRIEVRVKGAGGYTVRFRKGYFTAGALD
jgi:Ca-activated chloride channel family protein